MNFNELCYLIENKTAKIVINDCYGGFSVSEEVYKFLNLEWDGYGQIFNNDRANPKLIEAIEKLGEKANACYSKLKIVEYDLDELLNGYIYSIDGLESIVSNPHSHNYIDFDSVVSYCSKNYLFVYNKQKK